MCRLLNESLCEPTQLPFSAPNNLQHSTEAGAVIYMAAYNPLSYTKTHRVRLPVTKRSNVLVEVVELSSNSSISANILPSTSWASEKQKMALNSLPNYPKLALHSLVFDTIIPPLGLQHMLSRLKDKSILPHILSIVQFLSMNWNRVTLFSLKTS